MVNARQPTADMNVFLKGTGSVLGGWSGTRDYGTLDESSLIESSKLTLEAAESGIEASKFFYETQSEQDLESENSFGISDVYETMGFSFRLSSQMVPGYADFSLYETRWQQQFRIGESGDVWEEKPVNSFITEAGQDSGSVTMPYPGREAIEGSTYIEVTERFYNNAGAPLPRDDKKYDPATAGSKPIETTSRSPQEAYLVNTGTGG